MKPTIKIAALKRQCEKLKIVRRMFKESCPRFYFHFLNHTINKRVKL